MILDRTKVGADEVSRRIVFSILYLHVVVAKGTFLVAVRDVYIEPGREGLRRRRSLDLRLRERSESGRIPTHIITFDSVQVYHDFPPIHPLYADIQQITASVHCASSASSTVARLLENNLAYRLGHEESRIHAFLDRLPESSR